MTPSSRSGGESTPNHSVLDGLLVDPPVGKTYQSTTIEQSMGLYLTATVVFRLINFGRITLLAWYMTLQQMGLLNIILMIVSTLIPLCSLGLSEALTRFVPLHESRGTLCAFLRRAGVLITGVAAFSVAIMLIFAGRLGDLFYVQAFADPVVREQFRADAPLLTRLTAVVVGLNIFYFSLLGIFKGLRMFRALSWLEITHGALFIIGSVIMIATKQLSAFSLTIVFGVSVLLPVVYFGWRIIQVLSRRPTQGLALQESDWEFRLLRFSVWLTLSGFTWQALQYYSAWYLNKVYGPESAAVLTTVAKISQFILIGAVSVSIVAMATVTKTWESRGREAGERQLSLAFRGTGMALFFFCAALALAKDLVMKIFRHDYAAGAEIVPLQLLFSLLGGFLAFLPGHFNLREKTRHAFWAWAAGLTANVILAYQFTGPRLAPVTESAWWNSLGSILGTVFEPGFQDSLGLHSASWCAVLSMMLAMGLCLVLLRAEGVRLDRGCFIVIGASLLIVTRPWILAGGAAALLVAFLRTNLIIDAQERQRLVQFVTESIRHVPFARWRGTGTKGQS